MQNKLRKYLGFILGLFIILSGRRKRAVKKSHGKDIITCIYMHDPQKKLFRKTISWLYKEGFVFISTIELIEIIDGKIKCPKGAIHLSMDDCWRNNLENVIPYQQERGFPITFFAPVKPIEEGIFWWTKMKKYKKFIPRELLKTGGFKNIPNSVRLFYESKIDKKFSKSFSRLVMNKKELIEISKLDNIEIGSHSVTHPYLSTCTEKERLFEIAESKNILEKWTGRKINAIAYPIGDYNDNVIRQVINAGYSVAFTTQKEINKPNTPRFLIARFSGMDSLSFVENSCHIVGAWTPFVSEIKKIMGK